MKIEKGKFYFIKDEYFKLIKDKELCKNKERETKRPCFYCFKDKTNSNLIWFIPISSKIEKYERIYNKKLEKNNIVDTIVFGYVEGEKRAFLIQNMFPTAKEYIIEKYIKNKRDVTVNERLSRELENKANKILVLVEKGYTDLVFPNILNIRKKLNEINKK